MYFVLAGGFYGMSYKPEIWGFRPIQLGDADRGVDFVINIKGIPEELYKPEGVRVRYKYYCQKCKAYVPEWDMEQKKGCFFHDPEPQREEVPEWRTGVLEEYNPSRVQWLKGSIRIWLDSGPGQEKWMAIKRYIEQKFPATKSLSTVTPRPVGTRKEWTLSQEEIPVIDLTDGGTTIEPAVPQATYPAETVEKLIRRVVELENKLAGNNVQTKSTDKQKSIPASGRLDGENKRSKTLVCEICGEQCRGSLGYYNHRKFKHGVVPEKPQGG